MDLFLLFIGVLLLGLGMLTFYSNHLNMRACCRDYLLESLRAESASQAKTLLGQMLAHLDSIGCSAAAPDSTGEWYRTLQKYHGKLGAEGTNFSQLKKEMGEQLGSLWWPISATLYPHKSAIISLLTAAMTLICLSAIIAAWPHLM